MTIVVDNPNLEQEIPLDRIHADPFQPRLEPDADLAESIKTQGILQAIRVEVIDGSDASVERICPDCLKLFSDLAVEGGHFMIQDGERRYRGTIAAGGTTILSKVVPATTDGERLLRQLVANTGKPLTAVEDAFALRRLQDSEGWSQAELARKVGRPRSVVGDRIRLTELDRAWLDAISSGKLQVSHAAILSAFSEVPSEYQGKAAKRFLEDYRTKRYLDGGGSVPIDEMPRLLYVAFRDYIKPISKTPGYRGPIVRFKDQYSDSKTTYAADIKVWRPLFNKYESKRRKEGGGIGSQHRENRDVTVDKLEALPKRTSSDPHPKALEGEVVVYVSESGWHHDFRGDPSTFLANVDPAKLTRVYANHASGIVTSDMPAVSKARAVFADSLRSAIEPQLAEIRSAMRSPKIREYEVLGRGCQALLSTWQRYNNPVPIIAMAMGIEIGPDLTDTQAATLVTGYIAAKVVAFTVPDYEHMIRNLQGKHSRTAFRLPDPPKSKSQAKRDARAAGEQVGDPARAKKEKQVPIGHASEQLQEANA